MALALLGPRRELMDGLVERLIREETIDGESFRQDVEAWGQAHPEVLLPLGPLQLDTPLPASLLTRQSSREANVQTAQVGVQTSILDGK